MGAMKEYYHEYLTDTEFDLMFDDEYEMWLENKQIEKEEYEQAIGDGINQNYCSYG
jgi:predicted RNA-binding protein associated with RNAse of E/G family